MVCRVGPDGGGDGDEVRLLTVLEYFVNVTNWT
jgi:hypothetical protein